MNPSCYSLQPTQEGRFVRYLGEVSTAQCLAAFASTERVDLSVFGARSGAEWLTADEMPKTESAGWWISRLEDHSLCVVDFTAAIAGVVLSTHDDGEAAFSVDTMALAWRLLVQLVGAPSAEALAPVLGANLGSYVSPVNGSFTVYRSFEAYLDRA